MRIGTIIRHYLWKPISKLNQQVNSNIPYVFLPPGHAFDEKTGMCKKSRVSGLSFITSIGYPILLKQDQMTSDVHITYRECSTK